MTDSQFLEVTEKLRFLHRPGAINSCAGGGMLAEQLAKALGEE